MYKKNTHELGMPRRLYRKIWLIMRLTTIILLVTFLQVSAATHAQNVTLNKSNASLKSVFNDIKKQTGYLVLYPSALINDAKPVTVNLKNTPLKEALDQILENQNLEFEIQDNSIVLRKKEFSVIEQIKEIISARDASGSVIDENGQPLVGATVRVKAGKESAITNKDGIFNLKNIPEHATLIITYIGYKEKQISIDEELINIRMEVSDSKLDEVQIQAYGTTSKRLSTGNIATIKAADIEKQPVHNPIYALMGRVPGLIVTPTSGLQGAAVKVQLRGQNSLSDLESEPLFVVDGVPYANSMAGNIYQEGLGTISPLSFINPNDIESIDVLKDADATSIYGSRGANGVILITTKKGKVGQTSVNASFRTNLTQVPQFAKLMNTSQYLAYRKEAYQNSGVPVPDFNTPAGERNSTNYDLTLWDQNRYTDWQKLFFGNTGVSYFADASVSGGNNAVQYIIGGQYSNTGTVQYSDTRSKMGNVHFNITGTSSDQRLRLGLTGSYNSSSGKSVEDFTRLALTLPPNAPQLFTVDGKLNWEPDPATGMTTWDSYPGNPLARLQRATEIKSTNIIANTDFSYQITKNLKFSNQLGMTRTWYDTYGPSPISSQDPFFFSTAIGSAAYNNNGSSTFSIAPQLNYLINISKGTLTILTGGSYQTAISEAQSLYVTGYTNDAMLRNLVAGIIDPWGKSNTSNEYKYGGVFGRLNYNWQDKYIGNLTARRDGSSRFGPGNQFGNFGSVAGAWIFTNESFLSKKTGPLSYGKIRLSYGTSGNDNIGDYKYLETFDFLNGNYQGGNVIGSTGPVNPDYHWETTKKLEIGTDLGFFHDNILISFGYFRNRSSNQLVDYGLPATTGSGAIKVNQDAKIQQSGMELSVNANIVKTQAFTWKMGGNISFLNRNKLLAFNKDAFYPRRVALIYDINGRGGNAKVDPVGKPFAGYISAFEFRGVDPQTGDYTFANFDGSSGPNSSSGINDYAKVIKTSPDFYGGFSNEVSYKNFAISIFLQFSKQLGKNPMYFAGAAIPGTVGNQLALLADSWHSPGDQSQIQRPVVNYENLLEFSRIQQSDVAWTDASFVRLKTLSFSYSVPARHIEKLGIKRMQVFANAQNLFTMTGYKGLDPEAQNSTSLAPLREISFGLNIGL